MEFTRSITPKNTNYLSSMKRFAKPAYDVEAFRKECFEEIGHVFSTAVRAESILGNLRNHLELDADQLFASIDEYNLGYISTNMLSRYFQNKCGYKLNENEYALILNKYDKDGDYRISYEEFINEVRAPGEEEQQEEEENAGQYEEEQEFDDNQ